MTKFGQKKNTPELECFWVLSGTVKKSISVKMII